MLKNEFLVMMKQDLETKHDETLNQLLLCFEEILKDYPASTEIDNSKTIEECYKSMEKYAKENAKNNSYCFTPEKTKEFIVNYLGLKTVKTAFINLEDFI